MQPFQGLPGCHRPGFGLERDTASQCTDLNQTSVRWGQDSSPKPGGLCAEKTPGGLLIYCVCWVGRTPHSPLESTWRLIQHFCRDKTPHYFCP